MPEEYVLRGVIRVIEYFHGAEFRVIDVFEFICKSSISVSDCYGCEVHHSPELAPNIGILELQQCTSESFIITSNYGILLSFTRG